MITPIDSSTQARVCDEVQRYLQLAESIFQQPFPLIPIRFDIKGKTAGMYRVRLTRSGAERCIRFNPWLFAKYFDDSWSNTIPHEVAHYIADSLYGMRSIRPHGQQWQSIMRALGAEPIVSARYDMEGIPVRIVKRYQYRCQCREVMLTAYRHRKVQSGQQRYRCRDCGGELYYIP